MKAYAPQWWVSPIKLHKATSGSVSLEHCIIKQGEKLTVVGIRQAFMRGIRPVSAINPKPLLIHKLIEDDHGVWMTDMPEELNQIAQMLHEVQPAGRVLVGGLGLGIVATWVATLPLVDEVVVVECSADIIHLCKPRNSRVEVIHADINEYLKTAEAFDFYLLDTWQGTGEAAWWDDVMPLRRLIRNRHGRRPVIHCWAEDIMWGQIIRTMTHSEPHWKYEHLPIPMERKTATAFLRNVGLPAWERTYGKLLQNSLPEEAIWRM